MQLHMGKKAPTESFNTGADFGFYQGGLVGLEEGGKLATLLQKKILRIYY